MTEKEDARPAWSTSSFTPRDPLPPQRPKEDQPVASAHTSEPKSRKSPATRRQLANAIGGLTVLAIITVGAIVFWPMAQKLITGATGGGSSNELNDGVYDFTQTISSSAPIGPVDEITVRIPEELAQAVPGYVEGRYLESVTVSNAQYLGLEETHMTPSSWCSVDLELTWADGAAAQGLTDPGQAIKAGRKSVSMDYMSEPRPLFSQIADDWSTATADVACGPSAEFDPLQGGIAIAFDFAVTNAAGEVEVRRLALAPIRVTENGKLFVGVTNAKDTSNVPGWSYDGGSWSESYGDIGTGESTDEGGKTDGFDSELIKELGD